MSSRRLLRLGAVVVAAVAALAVLVGVARWEKRRAVAGQNAKIAQIRALVGPLDNRYLSESEPRPGMLCLFYQAQRHPPALELCFDPAGRLIEAGQQSGISVHYGSLRWDPAGAAIRVPPAELKRLDDLARKRRGLPPR